MATQGRSRWQDDTDDTQLEAQRKAQKEAKKRAKAEKQQRADILQQHDEETIINGDQEPAIKRRKLSPAPQLDVGVQQSSTQGLLHFSAPSWGPCRNVDNFEKLNSIEEGSYGWVSRARELATGEVVALKKLKLDNSGDGFPITGLREIQTLRASRHQNIIALKEVVVGGDDLRETYLVLPFIEHDLKSLLSQMSEPFLPSEAKTLLLQLTSAVSYLHSHWILHRDLKTSNLLLNNRGRLKVADFGMARYFSDPMPKGAQLTQLVVTLWYRAPELLLGETKYGAGVDVFSIGCVFGEILGKDPLLQGKNEVDQLAKIFDLTGLPSNETWPGYRRLPNARSLNLPSNPPSHLTSPRVRLKFPFLTTAGAALLTSMLALDPEKRPTAVEVLGHDYFREDPKPKDERMFPTFPSVAGGEKRRARDTPMAPKRGEQGVGAKDFEGMGGIFGNKVIEGGGGFTLRMS